MKSIPAAPIWTISKASQGYRRGCDEGRGWNSAARLFLCLLGFVATAGQAAPLQLRVLVKTNDVATGSGAARGFAQDGSFTYASISSEYQFGPPVAAAGGYFAFQARAQLLAPNRAVLFSDFGIWGGAQGRLATLCIQHGPAPGTGTNFVRPGLMNLSTSGLVLFYGDSSREDGLWTGDLSGGAFGAVEPLAFTQFSTIRPWQTEFYAGFYGIGGSNFIHNLFNGQTRLAYRPAMPAEVFGPGVTLSGAITVLGLDASGRYILQGNTSDGTNRIFAVSSPDQIVSGPYQGQPAPGIPDHRLGFMFASANEQGNIAFVTRLEDGDANFFNDISAVYAGSPTNLTLLAQSSPGQVWGGYTMMSRSNHVLAPGAGGEVGIYRLPSAPGESITFTPLPPLPVPRPAGGPVTTTEALNALGQYAVLYNDNNGPDLWFYNPGEGWTNIARRGVSLNVSGETIATYNIAFVGRTGAGTGSGLTDDGKLYFTVNGTHLISGDSQPRPAVELAALEVNQAVQDWNNSVPLVENKRTYVRAFVQTPDGSPDPVVVTGARVRGFRDGVELPGSPLLPMNPGGAIVASTNAASRRHNLFDSLVYWVPEEWRTGTVSIQFEWPEGEVAYREPAGVGGNAADGRVSVAFHRSGNLDLKFVRVAFTNSSGARITPSYASELELRRRLIAIYPIDDLRPRSGSLLWTIPEIPDSSQLWRVNLMLEEMRKLDGCGAGSERLYYGYMVGNLGGGEANAIPGTVASGWMPFEEERYGRNRHAHELGHVLGRPHAVDSSLGLTPEGWMQGYCREVAGPTNDYPFFTAFNGLKKPTLGPMNLGPDEAVWGLNTHPLGGDALASVQVVNPTNTYELMSYCGSDVTSWRWISGYAYSNLFNVITNKYAPATPPAVFQAAAVAEHLLFSGAVNLATDEAFLRPVLPVQLPGPEPAPIQGDYTLRLLDGGGAVVSETPFAPRPGEADAPEGGPKTMGVFVIPVLADPAIRQAQVVHNGRVLADRRASDHAPTITVRSPNGGERIANDPVTLRWQAQDADGDKLSSIVQFSSDGGTTWETLATDLEETVLEIRRGDLKGTVHGRIRVQVSDGFNTASDISDADFEVSNLPPDLVVLSPADNDLIVGSQQVLFEADLSDPEDGPLTETGVQWVSSIDGPLGTGSALVLNAAGLSESDHLVTVTGTDSGGATSAATIRLRVRREVSPMLEVAQEGQSLVVSWPAALADYVLETSARLDPAQWIVLTGAIETRAGFRRATIPAAGPQTFFRLRRR